MPASHLSVVPLIPKAQQYAWGKEGSESQVAKVLTAGGHAVDNSKPYAELWMGTHPSAPSSVLVDGQHHLLSTYIGGDLPYLFKILSIGTALSIQAHPDLALAAKLHSENPKEYKDANHKPEMATSITHFESMCGFRPLSQIAHYCQTVPELAAIVGQSTVQSLQSTADCGGDDNKKAAIKAVFSAVMNANESAFKPQLQSLVSRIKQSKPTDTKWSSQSLDVFDLIPRLYTQYPDDIGVFCPFLLNCFWSEAGRSVFLSANEPHAYISGDIVECMACSDNVVRAGLTPKFRDVTNLVSMLTYRSIDINFMKERPLSQHATLLTPPIPEFALVSINVPNKSSDNLPASNSHGILLILRGSGSMTIADSASDREEKLQAGQVWFVPMGAKLAIANAGSEPLVAFKCTENDAIKQQSQAKL